MTYSPTMDRPVGELSGVHAIKVVCIFHSKTVTGLRLDIAAGRKAIDAVAHPALLLVDTISSLGSIDYRHDEWGATWRLEARRKGRCCRPAFVQCGSKSTVKSATAPLPRSCRDWKDMLSINATAYFPCTPSTDLLSGLLKARELLQEEGLETSSSTMTARLPPPAAASSIGGWRTTIRTSTRLR